MAVAQLDVSRRPSSFCPGETSRVVKVIMIEGYSEKDTKEFSSGDTVLVDRVYRNIALLQVRIDFL
jgi:hypothetical protein